MPSSSQPPLPLLIDNLQFAKTAMPLQGELSLTQLSRLASLLHHPASAAQQIRYVLHGRTDQRQQHWLNLSVKAHLQVVCQRCLEVMPIDLGGDFSYLISHGEDHHADYDLEPPNVAMDVGALIEDELLMLLPISPRHTTCRALKTATAPLPSPFAVLKRD